MTAKESRGTCSGPQLCMALPGFLGTSEPLPRLGGSREAGEQEEGSPSFSGLVDKVEAGKVTRSGLSVHDLPVPFPIKERGHCW